MLVNNNKGRNYNYLQLEEICMQQINLREDPRKFGEARNKAALSETEQMHLWDTLKPILPSDL